MNDSQFFITLLHHHEFDIHTPRVKLNKFKEKATFKNRDLYKVDDLLLVSYDTSKTVELIEINLKYSV
jgi:hypothetical protein